MIAQMHGVSWPLSSQSFCGEGNNGSSGGEIGEGGNVVSENILKHDETC